MNAAKIVLFFIFAVCLVTVSCAGFGKIIDPVKKEQKEVVTKTYEKNGLSFLYPDNWQVSEDEILDGGARYVNVEDSDNSLFIITLFPPESSIDLEAFAENFVENISSNIPIGKVSDVKKSSVNRTIDNQSYKGIQYKYSAVLLGENIPHTSNLFSVEREKTNAIVVIQAPDEDWKAADKEFQIIFDSLKFE